MTLEAGPEGGDVALTKALEKTIGDNPELKDAPIRIVVRIGYHARRSKKDEPTPTLSDSEVVVEQFASSDADVTMDIIHDISQSAIETHLLNTPFLSLQNQCPNLRLIPLIHNPEVQPEHNVTESLLSLQRFLDEAEHGRFLDGFGIVSNGICLPVDHPLHLPLETAIVATQTFPGYSVTQLPVNLLETTGLSHARVLQAAVPSNHRHDVYAMRPLTCYPNRGTGTGNPFVLADQLIPDSGIPFDSYVEGGRAQPQLIWTNDMAGPPQAYETMLKAAMAHFDAEELIEAKVQGQPLSGEQRETLDGCKLLQSLFHDLDTGLEQVRSFASHEEYLYQKVIPLIHDTFESYDEETAQVLEKFFAAYSLAVRYSIAKNTRLLLKRGEGSGGETPLYDIPDNIRLQEFGLNFVLREPAIGKIIVGATEVDHIVEDALVANRQQGSQEQL